MAFNRVQHIAQNETATDAFTPEIGEIVVDTTNENIRLGDGVTAGGGATFSNDVVNATLYQGLDTMLTNLVGLVSGADKLPYFNGTDTWAQTDLSAFGRTVIDDADGDAVMTTLGISAFAQTMLDDADGGAVLTTLGVTAYAQTLLDDATALLARGTLELDTTDNVQFATLLCTALTSTGIDDNATSVALTIDASEGVYIGAVVTNANLTIGLALDQALNDDEIMSFGSTGDVAHGMTSKAETQVYGTVKKSLSTTGGLTVTGYGEGVLGTQVIGVATTVDTSKTSTANAPVQLRGEKKSGTSSSPLGANENVFIVAGGVTGPVLLADADGDLFASNATLGSSLDDYGDADLIRTHELNRSVKGIIRSEFDSWITYNKTTLEEAGIIGRVMPGEVNEDGSPATAMWSITGLLRLHSGAIVQGSSQLRAIAGVLVEAMPELRRPMELALERAGVGHIQMLH